MRRALVTFAPLALIAACRAPEPTKNNEVSIVGAPGEAKAAPPPSSTQATVIDAAAAPPKLRIEEVTLEITDAPSDAKPLPAGKALRIPGEYVARLESPARWLVRIGGGKRISVVDRDTGKVLGAIDSAYPDDVQPKHARLPGWRDSDKAPGLLMLADGRTRFPRARLSDGKSIAVERLLTHDAFDDVIVMGKDSNKQRHLGVWKLDAGDDVTLDQRSPVNGRAARWDPITKSFVVSVSMVADSSPGPQDCIAAFFDGKRSDCLRTSQDGSGLDMELLHGGFVAMRHGLVDTQRQREVRPSLGEGAMLTAALDSPARALFVINDGTFDLENKRMPRRFELLSPDGSFGTFRLDIATDFGNTFHSAVGQKTDPILAERGISQVPNDVAQDTSAVFVDLERGRVIRLPIAVSTLTRGTLPRRFLAVERGKPNDKLLFVDLDATKATRLGTMPSCPGPYWPSIDTNGIVALVCSKQPKPDLFSFVHLWCEVVQTSTMKRWHVDGDVLDAWPTGEIVRSAPGTVISEGSFASRANVRVVKLD